jgi:hypothetical protein
LYIITERYPSARKYRDIFERIKTSILSVIKRCDHWPRPPLNLDADVQELVESMDIDWGLGRMGAESSHMMSQMTGTQVGEDIGPLTVGFGYTSIMGPDPQTMPPKAPPGHTMVSLGDAAAGEQQLWAATGGVYRLGNAHDLY